MPIHLVCECGARVIAPTKRAGQSIRCPKCDARIPVPPDEGQAPSAFSSPTRPSRLESAISDLVTARHTDTPPPLRRAERIDPPQEKLRPAPIAPAAAPATVARLEPAPKLNPGPEPRQEIRQETRQEPRTLARPDARSLPGAIPAIKTISIDSQVVLEELPTISMVSPGVAITRPIRIVTAARGLKVDQGWLGAVYGLALLWSILALIGMAVAAMESYTYYRTEELWRLERWAFLVVAASTLQFALAIYLVQFADWIACRAAAVVISCIAAMEAMILAVTLFSTSDAWFARFLDLSPHMQDNRATGVALLLTLLSVLLAYTTANLSLSWQRDESNCQKSLRR